MLYGGEMVFAGGVGLLASLYLALGGSVVVMVFLIISFTVMVMFVLLLSDYFFWGVMMGLLYLGGMMVLFSYAAMLLGGVAGMGETSWGYKEMGGGLALAVTPLLVGGFQFPSMGGGGGMVGGATQLWLYSSFFLLAAAVVLVVVLLVCLHLCAEGWS
uniref:NADH dehydrogenase subunit 6 n=1 Tax=Phallusia mammillata TaxID=59560 RepID=A7WL66_9ASCI|nr:NADH dehydrogenase subunit 6 [Phallusia mammillata]CAL23079.2 NADH dehydrogenase subunit 6 [Phallusia mammillata]